MILHLLFPSASPRPPPSSPPLQPAGSPPSPSSLFPIISLPPCRPPLPTLSASSISDPCPKLHPSPHLAVPSAHLNPFCFPQPPLSLPHPPSHLPASAQPHRSAPGASPSCPFNLLAPEGSPCPSLLVPMPILPPSLLQSVPWALSPPCPTPQDLGAPSLHPPPPSLCSLHIFRFSSHLLTCCWSRRTQTPSARTVACLHAAVAEAVYLPTFSPSHPGAPRHRSAPGVRPGGSYGVYTLPRASSGWEAAPGGKPLSTLSRLPPWPPCPSQPPLSCLASLCDSAFLGLVTFFASWHDRDQAGGLKAGGLHPAVAGPP